ncbi:nucleotidyl transferase AbiEii/AbiGii toxin family protein [Candidatus Woesearchaeota archaeon]|jgi:predicted nucleotidyltransferase component of viral defense system|nr:nucleotidyl transferase AbiEii/AbiGii toxin family protein [Candidatus Woesearchaeota archaeon]MBT6519779.1 nucleotidyl transferase AbiEii/AbiGii toxin family protein [Candidatus Woesearchaeota archaeon]MBT7368158.1 nucleotidyl transferase AbiEii/AbiGii toxin family protein [Candidatus Woesearchaeota archaeon]
MDEIKNIDKYDLIEISAESKFNQRLIAKDYYITVLLYLMQNIEGIYFKGGTALQKIILDYSRLSEDIDFTVTRELNELIKEIETVIRQSKLFGNITKDKQVYKFTRLTVNFTDPFMNQGTIFIDLNSRAKLNLKPVKKEVPHFYPDFIPQFSCYILDPDEMIAEKMAATIGRNKPRDHFDLYQIISKGIKIDLDLVKKKCEQSGDEFNIIKMFNRAKKLHKKWNEDLIPLISEPITFQKVMKTISKHFNLKEEKEKLKDNY